MSFSFHAAGRRDQVLAQLAAAAPKDLAGKLAARLAADVITADTDAPPGLGQDLVYVVRCSGHDGGGLAASLDLSIEPLAVPAVP